MKTNTLLTAALLGLTITLASAQGPGRGGRGPGGPGGPGGEGGKRPDPAKMITHLSERYAALAGYDADKNGKLDATEQAAVAKAIEDGTLKFGPPGGRGGEGPGGEKPPVDKIAEGAAKMYESIAAYDADKSGSLDETEQAAVKKAIEDGTLKLPRPGGRGPGGRGPGGPGGRPEGGAPPPPPAE